VENIDTFISKLEDIFSVKVDFKINYVKSRDEMDKVLKRKTESWLVGTAREGQIYIFPKELFPKVSNQHSEKDFEPVLRHEIVHLFIHKAFGRGPAWFDEGLACILAGQKKKLPNENPDPTELIKGEDFRKAENPYGKSMKLVLNLLKAI